ncbi:short-chain dehydrogenase, putative [Trypanosoma brucei gambiense DAL972]|uniref:Short-chain dehydrogenase, putative n=1 Tax=Trypanosoma brucei gambiense (strain MHOM/CI/86/DAL972) TaxID=679716 RepID=C9ZZF1_TRYB9|nr:short-chain dehydrogenase, putative [Trypanosoma brucei gambiense DAL972]CBH14800.1 short-chain dehydrogenase, putative [Trypanosoma brucei gambiense DAL972]|eukprot:XP_011777066.1 short-chain dehydrogenase, putative [Trypanosoma brucei gambiense DAL972]
MLHVESSEMQAAITMCQFLLIWAFTHLFGWFWRVNMSGVSTTLLMISSCLICRRKAKGRSCRWPANTGKNSRVALVTGASSGIGFAVTQQLVEHGWRVVMAGRSEERLLEARKKIMVRNPSGCAIVVGVLDLSDLSSVRDFAEVVTGQKDQLSLSLLVNAAGVLRRRLHRCDGTGMEEMIATNVVGPMLLTELLLPLLDETALRTGASSRVVNIASSCHTFLGVAPQQGPLEMLKELHSRAPLSEDAGPRDFTLWNFVGYYGLSKLCMIWWTNILAQRVSSLYLPTTGGAQPSQPLPRVSVACCHPGIITTHLYRDLFPTFVLDYLIYYPSLLIGKTWTDGAQVVLRMAVEEERLVQGGYYLCDGEYGEKSSNCCLSAYAKDMKAAEEFCAWANMQIELQKDTPRVPKLRTKKVDLPRRLIAVKLL